MKSFTTFTAVAMLMVGSGAWAQDLAPEENLPAVEDEQAVATDGVYAPMPSYGAYADFPGYYPGFTSYRGMGFMGSCCEQTSCCALHAWDGFCETRNWHHGLFHGWSERLRCGLHHPGCHGSAACCDTTCKQKGCQQKADCQQKVDCRQKADCQQKVDCRQKVACPQKVDCQQKHTCDTKPCLGLHSGLHFGWKRPGCDTKGACCEGKCCDERPWHGLFDKPFCSLKHGHCAAGGKGCCEEPAGKCDTKVHKPLCHHLHGLRGRWWQTKGAEVCGKECGPVQGKGKGMWSPAVTEPQGEGLDPAPVPEPAPVDQLPPPPETTTTDYIPQFPDYSTRDRSATRTDLRRLPVISVSF